MYASDKQLTALLPSLNIAARDPGQPFAPKDQIQPCSIDLRLDYVFWRPLKRATVDLRRARLLEIEPRRYYRKRNLADGESHELKPGGILFGRVYEQFTIPEGFAGEITGRSSFARLGLLVNCTGGFINPGYRGHMPLQLVNLGANSIRLVPFLPVCQLRLVKLTEVPTRLYGHGELQSKYTEDDGGPSYWWRDKRIKALHAQLYKVSLDLAVQERILATVGNQEPEVIERLERLLSNSKQHELTNAGEVLERFALREDRRRLLRGIGIAVFRGAFPFLLALSLGIAFTPGFGVLHYVTWAVTLLALPLCLYALRTEAGDHLGRTELARAKKVSDRSPNPSLHQTPSD
jgi:deoxycytidine triphosphate deaminase